MTNEPLPRPDPPISVEAAQTDGTPAPDWTGSVVTRPEHHRCDHRLHRGDLNPKGLVAVVNGFTALVFSWIVILCGMVFGLASLSVGFENEDRLFAAGGLLMVCSGALQAVGAVGLALCWRRLHRPSDLVVGLAAVGFLVFLIVVGMTLWATKLPGFVLAAIPFGFVLWKLISLRSTLYGRDTCQTYPGFPPEIRALLADDPGPLAAAPDPTRFRIADCPHRFEFRMFRRSAQVMSIVNSMLLIGYVAVFLLLMAALASVHDEHEAVASALILLLPVANLLAVHEINLRSKRYHRAPLGISVGAFTGYAATVGTALWSGLDLDWPVALGVVALAAYWTYVAAYAMKALPPRSACASLREPPPAVQKILKA